MRQAKPLKTFWSKAAYEFAGDEFAQLQLTLVNDVDEIVQKAAGWFVHSVTRDGEETAAVLLCRGEEDEDSWTVLVQLGELREIEPRPGEEPLQDVVGHKLSIPMPIESEDNEVFAEIELPPRA